MKIVVDRFEFTDKSTIGTLTCGDFHCFTLEDTDRNLEDNHNAKQYGKTAIPRGKYRVIITFSNRFKKELPLLLDVPGYSGVRIHPGNKPEDTEGCILVGSSHKQDWISNSKATFAKLLERIEHALDRGDPVEVEIL
jgi:hypothetical protein